MAIAKESLPCNYPLPARNDSDAEATALIRSHLETELPEYYGYPVVIEAIEREVADMRTSFAVQVLSVHLTNGDVLKLFIKDFSTSILPKDSVTDRSNRENRVYRELLTLEDLGTAHYFGAAHKREQLSNFCTPWADKKEMAFVINCYLLHKVVKSLGDSVILNFSNSIVDKYLDMAKEIRQTLDKYEAA